MTPSNFLGYEYLNQVSLFVSRLTLLLNAELKLHFFDIIHLDNGEALQGFTISRYNITEHQADMLIKDLPSIYVNKKDSNSGETLFIITAKPETLQKWYDMMREGHIATRTSLPFRVP